MKMPIANLDQVEAALKEDIGKVLGAALNDIVSEIIESELPKGKSSSIANEIKVAEVRPGQYWIMTSDVWVWLNDGTGVYSSKHRGQGAGGRIEPVSPKIKALHFRNAQLAGALGFKDENVFLASVKGIQPRWYWDRYFSEGRIKEAMARAKV